MGYQSKRQWDDMEQNIEGDFADMIDFLLSILTQKDPDFVTVAGDTPARTRWRVARMTSRWKGEIEKLQSQSQQVIDNCLRRATRKMGAAREVELQMAAKHVQYIRALETGYREIRRLINTVWPLHGTTLIKRLRGEGRVKSASAIGQSGGAVVNEMLQKYMEGVSIPSLSSIVSTTPQLKDSGPIKPTPTPETRKTKEKSKLAKTKKDINTFSETLKEDAEDIEEDVEDEEIEEEDMEPDEEEMEEQDIEESDEKMVDDVELEEEEETSEEEELSEDEIADTLDFDEEIE